MEGSQSLALMAPCNHILFEGTRGPGKTDVQLMRFRKDVGRGYGSSWKGIIFDRQYKSLDDLIAKSKRWFPQFDDGAKFLSAQSQLKWVWPSGEELLFRHMDQESDYDNYHGHEYPYIGWNELTKYPTSACYDVMMSVNRTSFLPEDHTPKDLRGKYRTPDGKPLPPIPLTVFSTTNPFGAGHNWVKRKFIDAAPPGKVVRRTTEVFNPQTQVREDIMTTQIRLFGSYKENIYLDPQYIATLENITDVNRRKAWLDGDWDVISGGAFDDVWQTDVHILQRFKIPMNWRTFRTFDWGSTHPFSTGFWAISNGELVDVGGGILRTFPRGTLIRFSEVYGADTHNGERYGHNKGKKWSARKVAKEIAEHQSMLLSQDWIGTKPEPGPADGQIYGVNEKESGSIADRMAAEGVKWFPADKRPGSRINGLQLTRDMMEASVTGEGAGFYVMNNCEAFIETVPSLPRDEKKPDDIDTQAEDHVWDEVRYAVLDQRPQWVSDIPINFGL